MTEPKNELSVDEQIAGLSSKERQLFDIFLSNHQKALEAEGFTALFENQRTIIKENTLSLVAAVDKLGHVDATLSLYKEVYNFNSYAEEEEQEEPEESGGMYSSPSFG